MDVSKGSTKDDVLQIAQDMFFTLRLLDYQENCKDAIATVGTIFLATKLPKLTFYLHVEQSDACRMDPATVDVPTILGEPNTSGIHSSKKSIHLTDVVEEACDFSTDTLNDLDIMAALSSLLDAPGDDDDDVIFHQHDELSGVYDEENMTNTIP